MTIVGYTFEAEAICHDCMFPTAKRLSVEAGSSYMWGDSYSTEGALNEAASLLGLDREDETSFNSATTPNDPWPFPKVITLQMAEHDAGWSNGKCRCDRCGYDMAGDDDL